MTKYMTIKTEYTQKFNKLDENTNNFTNFNNIGEKTANYEDDFEEYNSEDDEQDDRDKTRLTNKASMKEIEDVVDIYKNELNENLTAKKGGFYNNNILEGLIIFSFYNVILFIFLKKFKEIKETTNESSLGDSSLKKTNQEIMTKDQRIMILKDRYSVLLGPDTFKKVVIFYSNFVFNN